MFDPRHGGLGERHYKIVYYGPPMSGKITNIRYLQQQWGGSASEIEQIESTTERIAYWDGLVTQGARPIRFHLYTLSGSVLYEHSWIRLLFGAHGIIFTADSDSRRRNENKHYFATLFDYMQALGYKTEALPLVLQYNKRDTPQALNRTTLDHDLHNKATPALEAIATQGTGVKETLTALIRLF